MKIRALNEPDISNSTSDESSNDDGRQQTLSKEAVEDQCFEKYRRALFAIQEFKEAEAKSLLEDLNDELHDLKTDQADSLVQLRFSVLKNLGNLNTNEIEHYVEALHIDPTDISLWVRAGNRGIKLGNFSFARQCYEQALAINSDNWVAIDRLIELYYILHLPFELYDICMRALSLNRHHSKAQILLEEAKRLQPFLDHPSKDSSSCSNILERGDNNDIVSSLERVKRKRRCQIQDELQKFKRARLGITLDTARTQSLSSFGNYIIKIYERFAKQGITRNSVIDITLNNTLSFTQQFGNNNGSINSQSINQNSSELQASSNQDIEMAIEADGASISDKSSNDKSNTNQRNEPTTSTDDNDQTKSNSNRGRSSQTFQKGSSLSFAAMLFPMDLGDKRRSSRNRSNQDDTFSFKMKFDELNELLPECLRIGAIEQVLQQRREEQQKDSNEKEKEQQDEFMQVETTSLESVREDLIIKDIIEAISDKLKAAGSMVKSDIKLCDMFYIYLSKLSTKKQNVLPEAFAKIYKIYRRLCPLPSGVFVEIGPNGLTIDELWFALSANEIAYQPQECPFLLRILEQLKIHLDEAQHREFLVRLFLVLGMNADHRYLEAALDNIEEGTRFYASNRNIITRAYVKTLIDKTNEKLQQENEDPDNSLDLINRLAPKSENEMSDREISSLCSAIKTAKVWQRGLDILNQRNDLNSDIIIDTINTCLKNGAKMDAILASKLCKDSISGSRPSTWTCLYRGWFGVLSDDEQEAEDTLHKMNKFFELGHQTLGKKGTCTIDKGEFLMLYVKSLLAVDDFEERELLGALNCLFGYPNKKPASVAQHKAQRVPMKWEYAETIYHYLVPEELPTYMTPLRKAGISSELVPLFKEIASVIPDELSPDNDIKNIEDYIDRGKPLAKIRKEPNLVTADINYFIADHYFKNKDFTKAKRFYNSDLAINPDRFDSWAASSLIRANEIEKALSAGDITVKDFVEGPFHDLVDSAIRCFKRATKLKPDEAKATLWIEFGALTYNLASLASRLFIYTDFECEVEGKSVPTGLDKLEDRHQELYKLAELSFESANSLCQSEEVWLNYYMLGKIYEKVDTFKALEYYYKADAQLFHEGASYPTKISYHNPPDWAYEAMEVHYRIHCCALKFLLTVPDFHQDSMNKIKWFLLNAQRSPFVEFEGLQNPKAHVNKVVEKDVGLLLNDMVDFVCKEGEFDELIFMCLHGMKRCLVRCDKNFKALYRLAHYYFKIEDPAMAQDILISKELMTDRRIKNLLARKPGVPRIQAAPPDLNGVDTLFKDRKGGNLFFNIWRIPTEEIDRPGSFEHWMFKCTLLLMQTCIERNDTNTLSIVAFQLSRQPLTSKKYLQDNVRVLLGLFAVKSIRKIILTAIEVSDSAEIKLNLIKEGMILADRFIKGNVYSDQMRELFNHLQNQAATAP